MNKMITQDDWTRREAKVLSYIEGARATYERDIKVSRLLQRSISILVLACAVIIPIAIVSDDSPKGLSLIVGAGNVQLIALTVSIILAIAEGLRRIFRWDQRWSTCYKARKMLKRARDAYRVKNIGVSIGSAEWQRNFADLQRSYDEIIDSETQEFFELVRADGTATGNGKAI